MNVSNSIIKLLTYYIQIINQLFQRKVFTINFCFNCFNFYFNVQDLKLNQTILRYFTKQSRLFYFISQNYKHAYFELIKSLFKLYVCTYKIMNYL